MRGARQLLTLRGPVPRRGLSCSQLHVIPDGSLLIEGGRIVEVGSTRRIENLKKARKARLVDVRGKVVAPALVDSGMSVAAGPPALRAFEQRIAGLPPAESARGRGAENVERVQRWLRLACVNGTGAIELHSSGARSTLKQLRALRALAKLSGGPVELIVGFTAAGAGAGGRPGEERSKALERIEEILRKASGPPRIASVFRLDCAAGRFDEELVRHCTDFANNRGYRVKLHTAGGRSSGDVALALELGAACVEGLSLATETEVDLLAASVAVATLFPSAAYDRGSGRFPPARRMLDRGAAVALASGFSSDASPGFGLPMAMALACREMKLMPEEALACCTINAAAAAGRAATIGSLEPNKQADLAVFDVADYREIPYYFGVNLCTMTMKRGRIAYWARAPKEAE